MIAFRHADPRFPFLWESSDQPAARWHGEGEGPAQYLADTPNGAWAEFLRHEEITDPADLPTISRAIWAIEIGEPPHVEPRLSRRILTGDRDTYEACRVEARRQRAAGAEGLSALSAALLPGGAGGWRVQGGVRQAGPRNGRTIVLFGPQPVVVGWPATVDGRPGHAQLQRVRHFTSGGW